MSAGYDDRDDDDDRPRRRRDRDDDGYDDDRPRRGTAAARRAALPGLFLILNGLLGIVFWVAAGGVNLADPMLGVEFLRKMAADQPDANQKKQLEDRAQQMEDQIKANPGANTVSTVAQCGALAVANALAVFGGIRMRSGRGWGWGLTGSLVSIVPVLTGCCCTGIPFGIWGLVVLVNPDVKAAFRRRPARYDDEV